MVMSLFLLAVVIATAIVTVAHLISRTTTVLVTAADHLVPVLDLHKV